MRFPTIRESAHLTLRSDYGMNSLVNMMASR